MRLGICAAVCVAMLGWPVQSLAQDVRQIEATRVTTAPRIDGRLDDQIWQRATPVGDLLQRNPDEGQPATEATEVRFLFDGDALYVGARMSDSRPDGIRGRLARRDTQNGSDFFMLFIDSRHDHLTAYEFQVNPSGTRLDGVHGADGSIDYSWDPVWSAATSIDEDGWSAEYRIPLSQLRFQPGSDVEWGVQFARGLQRRAEFSWFELVPRTEQLGPSRYGHLSLPGAVESQGRLEVAPYALTRAESRNVAAGNPFRGESDYNLQVGADLSFGITSDLTLNATVNPDFGQVEVDPAVVNLTAFETFFPEQRPFFVEGAELFRFGQTGGDINNLPAPNLFYSRRIGRAPQRRLFGYNHVESPSTSTIAGAAKITGRVGERWTVGVLGAATLEESADVAAMDGTIGSEIVEPFTNTLVARARGDFRGGQTTVGAIATGVNRDLSSGPLDGLLTSGAYVGGIDFNHTWDRRSWFINGFLAGSHVRGSEDAILRLQHSPARFYQRPDADHLSVDPTRTSLSGTSGGIGIGRVGGEHWLGSVVAGFTTPGWEINDAGFFQSGDAVGVQSVLTYRDTEPNDLTRFYRIDAGMQYWEDLGGDTSYRETSIGTIIQWANYFQTSARLFLRPGHYTTQITRGGPMAYQPGHQVLALQGGSDPRKSWQASWNIQLLKQDIGGAFRSFSTGLTLRPSTALSVSVAPSYQKTRAKAQYVGSFADPVATETYGRRYVLADMDQQVFSLNTRVNWTFAPGLSLELFAQPFVAAGDFGTFKELARPYTIDLNRYGIDVGDVSSVDGVVTVDPDGTGPASTFAFREPDFSIRSLRGNAVLRWEYRPGSTLFFVWQQQRQGFGTPGEFDVVDDFGGLLDAPAENVFAIKATYWIGL